MGAGLNENDGAITGERIWLHGLQMFFPSVCFREKAFAGSIRESRLLSGEDMGISTGRLMIGS